MKDKKIMMISNMHLMVDTKQWNACDGVWYVMGGGVWGGIHHGTELEKDVISLPSSS